MKTKNQIVIISTKAATPVGLNAAQTCASVRAGISRFSQFQWKGKLYSPFITASIPDNCLTVLSKEITEDSSLTFREKRIIRLAELVKQERQDPVIKGKTPLILGLPDKIENPDKVFDHILKLTEINIDRELSRFIANGRASGLIAVDAGIRLLKEGRAGSVIAGGIDTFEDMDTLGSLYVYSRLKSGASLDGFIPGEGACFLYLTTAEKALKENIEIKGSLRVSAVGVEESHFYSEKIYKGEGLSETFGYMFDNGEDPTKRKVKTIYSSMNGESYWGKELGTLYAKFKDKIEDKFALEHPADCYGDTGAASGPLMIALALTGIQKGYAKDPVLVCSSSDYGERGLVVLTKKPFTRIKKKKIEHRIF